MIRVSGPQAMRAAAQVFRPTNQMDVASLPSRKLHHGWIQFDGDLIDEALLAIMRAPRSFTAEDVVELQCHGSPQVLQSVLTRLCQQEGVRLARAGEFTRRAFLNGRLDLTRVEAISDLIHADSKLSMLLAAQQLRGKLYETIQAIQETLIQVASLIEAWIEFPDEDEEFMHQADCERRLAAIVEQLKQMLRTAESGKIARNGVHVVLCGRPNVGKSSLLNALLRENRAIVTDVPGTTRDVIEETLEINQITFRLNDTAGIRDTTDLVEREGVERSRRLVEQADLVLLLLDGSKELMAEDQRLLEDLREHSVLIVATKQDLWSTHEPQWLQQWNSREWIGVSTKHLESVERLEQRMWQLAVHNDLPALDQPWLTNLRQQQAAERALQSVEQALVTLKARQGEEFLAADLRRALDALGEIVGQTTPDDLLGRVFAEFCIGK